jgi:hypothetical protein
MEPVGEVCRFAAALPSSQQPCVLSKSLDWTGFFDMSVREYAGGSAQPQTHFLRAGWQPGCPHPLVRV